MRTAVVCILLSCLFSTNINAQVLSKFDELSLVVRSLVPQDKLDMAANTVSDCTGLNNNSRSSAKTVADNVQWIYNGLYQWSVAPTDLGMCVHMIEPDDRWLGKTEAGVLLTASSLEFPVLEETAPAQPLEPDVLAPFPQNFYRTLPKPEAYTDIQNEPTDTRQDSCATKQDKNAEAHCAEDDPEHQPDSSQRPK